jgi:hypothetical protein
MDDGSEEREVLPEKSTCVRVERRVKREGGMDETPNEIFSW